MVHYACISSYSLPPFLITLVSPNKIQKLRNISSEWYRRQRTWHSRTWGRLMSFLDYLPFSFHLQLKYTLILQFFYITSPIWPWIMLDVNPDSKTQHHFSLRWPMSTSSMEGWLQRLHGCQGHCQPLSVLIHPSRASGVHSFPWAPADIALYPSLHSSQAV